MTPMAIEAASLRARLASDDEIALIDVREQGQFFGAHLFYASCIPLSRLEMTIADLVPRLATPIALCDEAGAADGPARRAAERLAALGYEDVAVLTGGVAAWREAGFELYAGVNVPSKTFGEIVEQRSATPHLAAEEVKAMIDAGRNMVILDARPFEEYHRMNIPTAIDVPGAELVLRVHDLAPDPETFVVVNCAGRTRSIIGAQSLINAGIENPVAALKDGTMGWHLAGLPLEHGCSRLAPAPSAAGLEKARGAAAAVGERFGVRTVDRADLARFDDESAQRTTYKLDVRSPAEFAAGHIAGSRNAPGGQLVQATDEYIATRGARVVLIDDTGVRATMTASWLIQMGWPEVFVLTGGHAGPDLEQGTVPARLLDFQPAPTIEARALAANLDSDTAPSVVDVETSDGYRRGHVPGAYWAVRARLASCLDRVPAARRLVFTSADGVLAHYAAREATALRPDAEVRVLAGGTDGWTVAGLPLEVGEGRLTAEPDDVWTKPYEKADAREQAMRDYLTWEVALVEQVERGGDARFKLDS